MVVLWTVHAFVCVNMAPKLKHWNPKSVNIFLKPNWSQENIIGGYVPRKSQDFWFRFFVPSFGFDLFWANLDQLERATPGTQTPIIFS